MEIIRFNNLTTNQKGFLETLQLSRDANEGIPIMTIGEYRSFDLQIDASSISDGQKRITVVNDVYLCKDSVQEFEKQALNHKLCRAGVGMQILTSVGTIAVFDPRHNWYHPAPCGKCDSIFEIQDPIIPTLRECAEEVFIYRLTEAKNGVTRIIPNDSNNPPNYVNKSNMLVQSEDKTGVVTFWKWFVNERNAAIEFWYKWDIRHVTNFHVLFTEDNCHDYDVYSRRNGKITGKFTSNGFEPSCEHPAWKYLEA